MLESLLEKVAGLQTCNFIKKRLENRCFSVKFDKLFRTAFSTERFRWLLLDFLSVFSSNLIDPVKIFWKNEMK